MNAKRESPTRSFFFLFPGTICSGSGACLSDPDPDPAPDLYIPYWSTLESETTLIITAPSATEVKIALYTAAGERLTERNLLLEAVGVPAILRLSEEFPETGARREGALMLHSAPDATGVRSDIVASALISSDKTASYRVPAISAPVGVWTTFAQVWGGSYLGPNDELFVFCPDTQSALPPDGDLTGIQLKDTVFIAYAKRVLEHGANSKKTKSLKKIEFDAGYLSSLRPRSQRWMG